jgi:hypothetical protein
MLVILLSAKNCWIFVLKQADLKNLFLVIRILYLHIIVVEDA